MNHYLVLIKREYTRDIRVFTGIKLPEEAEADLSFDERFESGWRDAEGDILVGELTVASSDDALKQICRVYSDASPEIFRIVEVKS